MLPAKLGGTSEAVPIERVWAQITARDGPNATAWAACLATTAAAAAGRQSAGGDAVVDVAIAAPLKRAGKGAPCDPAAAPAADTAVAVM